MKQIKAILGSKAFIYGFKSTELTGATSNMGGFAVGGGCGFWCDGWFAMNFLDLSFVVRHGFCCGFGWDLFEFFGFEFCCCGFG